MVPLLETCDYAQVGRVFFSSTRHMITTYMCVYSTESIHVCIFGHASTLSVSIFTGTVLAASASLVVLCTSCLTPWAHTGQSHVALQTPSNITCIGQNIHLCAAHYSICKWLHLHCSLVPPDCITQADDVCVCVVCVTLLLHKMWSFVRFERGWCFSSSPRHMSYSALGEKTLLL